MDKTQIKCYLNSNEIRRFDYDSTENFDDLQTKIRTAYTNLISGSDSLKFYWLDDELERIGLNNTSDINYAIQFSKTHQLTTLKIIIIISKGLVKSKKAETKSLKTVNQDTLNESFKSYVCEEKIFEECTDATEVDENLHTQKTPSAEQRPTSPIITDFKKLMENLRKKVNKDINNIYVKNFKHFIPKYKTPDLSEQQAATSQKVLVKDNDCTNEELKKLEKLNEEISNIIRYKNDSNELEEVLPTTSGMPVILTDRQLADIFSTLKAMGLEEDEDGCLRKLVIEKNGDISTVVECYFDLCFQKIIRDVSNEKRFSGLVQGSIGEK